MNIYKKFPQRSLLEFIYLKFYIIKSYKNDNVKKP